MFGDDYFGGDFFGHDYFGDPVSSDGGGLPGNSLILLGIGT